MSCDHCGATLPSDEWFPATDVVEDGRLEIYSFCNEECQQFWSDGEGSRTSTERNVESE